jgi:hypothetical protein
MVVSQLLRGMVNRYIAQHILYLYKRCLWCVLLLIRCGCRILTQYRPSWSRLWLQWDLANLPVEPTCQMAL